MCALINNFAMFNIEWENKFLFSENFFGNAECLVCKHITKRNREYYVKRHYSGNHSIYESVTGSSRELFICQLKKPFYEQFINDSLGENSSVRYAQRKASFAVALELAKQGRPFEDGVFFKNMCQKVFQCFSPIGQEVFAAISSIPLSRTTITRRTEVIGRHIYNMTMRRVQESKYFSICIDESTDISDVNQLIIYVKTVDENFDTKVDLLSVVSMHGHVTGNILYNAVYSKVLAVFDITKLSSICTDGAQVMVGRNEGLSGTLSKNGYNFPFFHCIIHQQALFAKCLNMTNAMQVSVKIINRIRGGRNSLRHRKFKKFLKEIDADYGDLLLFTEVRWLSRGKSLKRVFDLRREIVLFLENDSSAESQELLITFRDPNFILDLAFLVDISEQINQLNLTLQGRDKQIFDLVLAIEKFHHKLSLLINNFKENDLTVLRRTRFIVEKYSNHARLQEYQPILDILQTNFHNRFHDFYKIKHIIEIHNDPTGCNTSGVSLDLKSELEKMQRDLLLPRETGQQFWKNLNDNFYPKLKNEMWKLYSMFGTTYCCEVSFSTLKLIKSNTRNKISDRHLEDLLRIKFCGSELDLDKLVQNHENIDF